MLMHGHRATIGHVALEVVTPKKLLSLPPQPRQSPASKIHICPGSSPEFNDTSKKKKTLLRLAQYCYNSRELKSNYTANWVEGAVNSGKI